MTNQNQDKVLATAPDLNKCTRLAFVGCENCQSNCCGGRFTGSSVLLNELHDTAKLFPIVFMKDGKKIKMSFIFSLNPEVPCPYLDSHSKKCTVYEHVRPRICRSYPFRIDIKTRLNSKPVYRISAIPTCPGIQESADGLQLITAEGKISKAIIDNFIGQETLANHEKNLHSTKKFLELVNEFDLLAGEDIVIGKKPLPGGKLKDVKLDVLKISEKRLAALDADSLSQLRTTGYINAINIHLISLANFRRLFQAVATYEKFRQSINL